MAGCKIDFLCTLRIPQIILRLWGFLHVRVRDAGHRGNKITEDLFLLLVKSPSTGLFLLTLRSSRNIQTPLHRGQFYFRPPIPWNFHTRGCLTKCYWDNREKGFWPSILFLSVVNKFQSLFVSFSMFSSICIRKPSRFLMFKI